jgi:hypothetical protein
MTIFDIVTLALIVGVFVGAHLIFSIHPFRFAEALVQEFEHLFARERTTGAANAVGILCVTAVGFLIIIENGLGFLANFVASFLGPDKAHAYVESVSSLTLLIVIAAVAVCSAFFTLLCEI